MSPYYQSIRKRISHDLLMIPAVALILHNENHELLLQQKPDGSWSLPAGAIEPGETPQQAGKRELLEETGYTAEKLELVDMFGGENFRFTYPNQDQVEYLIVLFKCHTVTKISHNLDSETAKLEFFPQESIPSLALPYPLKTLYS